jgi:hypothetical protein
MMKQLILLVAIYSLILHQIGKSEKATSKPINPTAKPQYESSPKSTGLPSYSLISPILGYSSSTLWFLSTFTPSYRKVNPTQIQHDALAE